MQTIHLKEGFIYLWFLTFKLNYHFVLKKSYNNDDKIAGNFKEIIKTLAMQRRLFHTKFSEHYCFSVSFIL